MARSTHLLHELATRQAPHDSDSGYFSVDLVSLLIAGVLTFFMYA